MNKTLWITLGIGAVAVATYVYRDKIFGKKDEKKSNAQAGSGTTNRLRGIYTPKQSTCPETWNGYHCKGGAWVRNENGVCYCTGELVK